MLAQSLRASRTILGRAALRQPAFARTFITPTAVRQADTVTDIYLRELKGYKVAPEKPSDAEGQVKVWSAPAPPKAPESANVSLADELKSYEAQEVEVEGQATAAESQGAPIEEDWFEEELAFAEEEAHH